MAVAARNGLTLGIRCEASAGTLIAMMSTLHHVPNVTEVWRFELIHWLLISKVSHDEEFEHLELFHKLVDGFQEVFGKSAVFFLHV